MEYLSTNSDLEPGTKLSEFALEDVANTVDALFAEVFDEYQKRGYPIPSDVVTIKNVDGVGRLFLDDLQVRSPPDLAGISLHKFCN